MYSVSVVAEMESTKNEVSEIQSWLEVILQQEQLLDLHVQLVGNSEKGDGYMGDIVFVTVEGTASNGSTKKYNLVLKCSKRSQALRESTPVKLVFMNEISLYQTILPYFIQFQDSKDIANPFNNAPKCYGSYTEENMEVIAFENLKIAGYELWPKKKPLTRKHIDLIVRKYSKLHATSVALELQEPNEFQKLKKSITNIIDESKNMATIETMFGTVIEESSVLLKDHLDEDTLKIWKGVKNQVIYIIKDMLSNNSGLKVITHGDCWNNNFMFIHKDEIDEKIPVNVAFLDWQTIRYTTPIADLSYFLMACLSEEDLKDIDKILLSYHNSFVKHLKETGTKDADDVYPFKDFLSDWKCYSRYGILMAGLLMKIVSTEKDEVVDMGQLADSGKDISATFANDIKDKENFKKRILPIVVYAVKNNLI